MTLLSFRKLAQSISIFRNDKKVSLCSRRDISEGQALVILINNGSWDIFSHNLVENGDLVIYSLLFVSCFLCFVLFVVWRSFLKLEVFEGLKSDVLLYIWEVPAKVERVRLATAIIFQMHAD